MFESKATAATPATPSTDPASAIPLTPPIGGAHASGGGARSALLGAVSALVIPPAASFVARRAGAWIRANGLPYPFAPRPTRWQRTTAFLGEHRGLLLGGLGLVAAAGLVRWQLARLFTEEPEYEVERTLGAVEIRRYPPRLVAETTIETGSFRDALQVGFRRLADYIFGDNHPKAAHGLRFEASAALPVRPADDGQAIAMTTPVTTVRDGNGWKMAFNLPKTFSPETLPEPTDARVRVRREPERRIAALRFTGGFDHTRIEAAELELLAKLSDAGLEPVGEPAFAGYDAPSTLPFLRRNEAWVVLEDDAMPLSAPASTATPRFGASL